MNGGRNSRRFGILAAAGVLWLIAGPARGGFVYLGVEDNKEGDLDDAKGTIKVAGVVIGPETGPVVVSGTAKSDTLADGFEAGVGGKIHRIVVTDQTIQAGPNGANFPMTLWASDDYVLPVGRGKLTVTLEGFFTGSLIGTAPADLLGGERIEAENVSKNSFKPNKVAKNVVVPGVFLENVSNFDTTKAINSVNEFPGKGVHEAYLSFILKANESVTLSNSAIYDLASAPVPEPGSLVLFTLGTCGLIGYARKARRKAS